MNRKTVVVTVEVAFLLTLVILIALGVFTALGGFHLFSHPQAPAPAGPAICTSAGATALSDYWQNQIDSASAASIQSVIAQATEATQKALNYCESIAG